MALAFSSLKSHLQKSCLVVGPEKICSFFPHRSHDFKVSPSKHPLHTFCAIDLVRGYRFLVHIQSQKDIARDVVIFIFTFSFLNFQSSIRRIADNGFVFTTYDRSHITKMIRENKLSTNVTELFSTSVILGSVSSSTDKSVAVLTSEMSFTN